MMELSRARSDRLADLLAHLQAALADRYTLERELGRGGMAVVYLARDLKHHRQVAIKVLRPELGAVLGAERFLREIEVAAGLSHPHILPLHDSGETDGFLYYVMPYVAGESLRDRLTREQQLPLEDALQIAREVADALSYAHGREVVHRDIKPENILLEARHAVVSDFGIARAISAAGGERLTQTGIAVGTPSYMSPEQAAAEPAIDARSDVYSLGCVLFEMLAGEPPYTGPTAQAILAKRLSEPVPHLRTLRDVPEYIEHAVTKALAKAPADRFATAAEFAAALSAPIRPLAPTSGRPRAKTAVRLAVSMGLLIGIAWAVAQLSSRLAAPIAATRIAVLPFAVRGSESFAYLAEGLVDLLSRNLDGAEDLRSVDPGTVLTTVARSGGMAGLDVDRGRAVAQRLGASLYVLGTVLTAGGRLRIQAALYAQQPQPLPSETVPQAMAEGDSSELFELVDRLSRDLLVGQSRGVSARLAQTVAVTTRSLPALKAYLGAERELRAGEDHFDSAVAGFQRATALDSTFALAYYRLAVAASWANQWGVVGPATKRAITLGRRLADRDRRLLEAFDAFRRGGADDAERRYRAILEDFPDDLEAKWQLASVLWSYNARRGRPRTEAGELFDGVLAIDPEFHCPI
jgi:serine/threonine-protein kinase